MDKLKPNEDRPQPNSERKPYNAPKIEESGRYEHLVLNCAQSVTPACVIGGAKSAS